jgi:hypothetical protein
MSQHKYDKDVDREVTSDDIKNRLIVLMENGFDMPETHIYDEPVRYFKMNLQWAKIFAGWLAWMEHPAFWKDASDTDYEAIQQILLFEEGIEAVGTVEDICAGVICALEKASSRFLAGVAENVQGGVTINPDGTIEFGGEGQLPEDDPTTAIDETEATRNGGITEIAAKLEAVLDKIDTLYGGTNGTPTTVEATAQTIMRQYFLSDSTLMNAAVSAYYAYRATNGQLNFDRTASSNAFPLYLYCNGYDINTLSRYLGDISGFPFAKQQIIIGLWDALTDGFFSHYFNIGIEVPNNSYVDAACVPMPYQEYSDIPYASVRNLQPAIAKGGHRLKIKVSGYYVDPDGDIQDAFWYRTAAGVLTRSNFTFSHAAGANMPSDNQVPYNALHEYEYTVDLSTGTSSWSVQFNRNGGMNVASTSPTSGFDIEITDLGLAVSQ